jgi:hypothetical protein
VRVRVEIELASAIIVTGLDRGVNRLGLCLGEGSFHGGSSGSGAPPRKNEGGFGALCAGNTSIDRPKNAIKLQCRAVILVVY